MRPSVEIRDECPYCGYRFTIDARDITGELHALRCLDCKEKFVVEVVVSVTHQVDGIAGVEPDGVLDRLSGIDPRKAEAGDLNSEDPDARELPAGDEKLEMITDATRVNDQADDAPPMMASKRCDHCTKFVAVNGDGSLREHDCPKYRPPPMGRIGR